jgi:hypothetical protein
MFIHLSPRLLDLSPAAASFVQAASVPEQILFPIVLAIVAAAYAAVGRAGGTGYIAVMGLIGLCPDVIRPTALALNIIAATVGVANFARAGLLKWRGFYPFAILGMPFSVFGGATHLSQSVYQPFVGTLLISAGISSLEIRSLIGYPSSQVINSGEECSQNWRCVRHVVSDDQIDGRRLAFEGTAGHGPG